MKTGHGNDIYNQAFKIQVDFSSNILPGGLSDELLQFLQRQLGEIRHYPDVESTRLKELIANHHGLSAKNVLVTNGANEAFYLLAQWKQAAKSVVFIPSYAEYADACKMHDHELVFHPYTNFNDTAFAGNQMVWLGNPNNPTGKIQPSTQIEDTLRKYRQITFVVDEAYAGCTNNFTSLDEQVTTLDNLVVVRSLTKQFGIPGLRLGYILANEKTIAALSALQVPWSVNRMAQLAGEWIFAQNADNSIAKYFNREAQRLQQQLKLLEGVETYPSACNFFLAKLQKHTASNLKQWLLQHYGFLIRDAANFKGLRKNHFRIAAQTPEENKQLVAAISEFCQTHNPVTESR